MSDFDRHQEIRRLLKHAWPPFFGGFGRLTEIQLETIPRIMEGSNVVVSAPTASGKTEAVVAPVVERLMQERWSGLSVLYIIPTRALGNDIFARLEYSLIRMGITLNLKHGDRPSLPEKKNLPNILITTPESLDSIICRRTDVLADVRTVILDELHLVDGTYRGDQLRILLRRLKAVASNPDFSIHALSATLSDPTDVSSRYGTGFQVVTAKGHRTMDLTTIRSLAELSELARKRGFKKILCFCNKREAVEATADELGKLFAPYPVVPHYGKLGLSLRNEAEKVMQESPVAVCVATSTLEIGIDIGDIDLVFLAETPWSLSAFVQRIGRGKRRADMIDVAVLVQTEEEAAMIKNMVDSVEKGQLESQDYQPDLSVAVQQVFSYLYQHKDGASDQDILDLLSPLSSEDECLMILDHLEQEGWLEFRDDTCLATTKLTDRGDKGHIHSNIPTVNELRVVDIDSGKEIGHISRRFSNSFVLGHKTWQVVGADDKSVKVRRFEGKAKPARFRSSRELGAYASYLPEELRPASDGTLGDSCLEVEV